MLYIIGGLSYCCVVYMWLLLLFMFQPMQFAATVIGQKKGVLIIFVLLWPILFPWFWLISIYTAIRGK